MSRGGSGELDGTTRAIVDALDEGRDTVAYHGSHVKTAEEIRDILRSRPDTAGYLEGEGPDPGDPDADLQRAEEYLAGLRRLGEEEPMLPTVGDKIMLTPSRSEKAARATPAPEFLGGQPDTRMTGLLDTPGSHNASYATPGSLNSPHINVQMFGSEEAPNTGTVGLERYIINPTIAYPPRSGQDHLHHPEIRMTGSYGGKLRIRSKQKEQLCNSDRSSTRPKVDNKLKGVLLSNAMYSA